MSEKFINGMGKEFYNADMQKILKKHDNHYSMYSTLKASVVERFNRTLKKDNDGRYLHSTAITSGSTSYASRVRLQSA